MLRPKPTHLSSSEVTLKGRHAAPRQPSFDSTPEKDNSTSGVALSNYQRQSYLENTPSELTLQTTHVDNDTRQTEHAQGDSSFHGNLSKQRDTPF